MSPSYRRSPRRISGAFERLESDLAPATLLAEAQRCWAEVVGSVIAGEAQPAAERAGVLTVICSASVWAQELDLMGPEILARLNGRLSEGTIRRLRCTTA